MVDRSKVFRPGDNLNAETVNWLNDTLLSPEVPPLFYERNDTFEYKYDVRAKSTDDIPPYGICVPSGQGRVKLYDGGKFPYMLVCDRYGCVGGGGEGNFSFATEPTPILVNNADTVNISNINIGNSRTNPQYDFGPKSGTSKAYKYYPPFHVMGQAVQVGSTDPIVLAVQRFRSWEYGKTISLTGTGSDQLPINLSDIIPGSYQITVLANWKQTTLSYGHIGNLAPYLTLNLNAAQSIGVPICSTKVFPAGTLYPIPCSSRVFTFGSLMPTDTLYIETIGNFPPVTTVNYIISLIRFGIYEL